jgi:diacylglycerol kinase family enzyme
MPMDANALTPIDAHSLRFGVLLNRSSGSCDVDAESSLVGILHRAGAQVIATECVDGHEIDAAIARLVKSSIDVLVILGGDGTIRTAAEKCGGAGIILIPLPGGTMNMLPRALYSDRGWQAALTDTLANPEIVAVSGGQVEGHRFFCAAIFGSPALWSGARESIRRKEIFTAYHHALRAFHRTFSRKVRYQMDGIEKDTSTAVVVICPLISNAIHSDVRALEAAALDLKSSRDAFRLAWNAVFSDWRLDASVHRAAVQTVKVMSRGRMPAILDGEGVSLGTTAEIRFAPDCFKALVPAGASAQARKSSSR